MLLAAVLAIPNDKALDLQRSDNTVDTVNTNQKVGDPIGPDKNHNIGHQVMKSKYCKLLLPKLWE